jgi:hypothetical protein
LRHGYTAKNKTNKPKAAVTDSSLEGVYEELVRIMKRHAPPFRAHLPLNVREKRAFQLTVPKPVAVPGAYGGKPVDLQLVGGDSAEGICGILYDVHPHARRGKEEDSARVAEIIEGQDVLPPEATRRRITQGY